MVIAPLSLRADYWDSSKISEEDLEFLYNYLLETETPMTKEELTAALVAEKINREKKALENRSPKEGKLYIPKDHYQVGETLVFPAMSWKKGTITNIRQGFNPDLPPFDVIEVQFEGDGKHSFASGIQDHKLNEPVAVRVDDPQLDPGIVMRKYGDRLAQELNSLLEQNQDLVKIASQWFPRSLLVDVNIGHLNLAEAALEMARGGPLPTKSLLDQIELPTDVNLKLTEFSLNLALQEDERFDEVGPVGKVLWYLKRLEPEEIQRPPIFLRYFPVAYDPSNLTPELRSLEAELDDELSSNHGIRGPQNEATTSLIFPHWRVGTLPLSDRIRGLFPNALEAPRIRFTIKDGESGEAYPGWVAQDLKYVFGLKEFYQAHNLIPGSLIKIQKSKIPGEMIFSVEKRRTSREWVRTILIGADGGIVYAMLKQVISSTIDERMAIAIPEQEASDQVWEQGTKNRSTFSEVVADTMRELAKLNPQGHVHAQELYAAINVVRRSPPGPIFNELATRPWFTHVGDLYYRLDEKALQERTK